MPAHAATALQRLALLTASTNVAGPDPKLEKHGSFLRLRDRVDELLATQQGRVTFTPADFALIVSSLAKVVVAPATEGAIGRIFGDIADEAEMRISSEASLFTASILGDLAWGISKSGNANTRFLRTIVRASIPKMEDMSCQDLANFAAAYADKTSDEAEELLRGILDQTKQRLRYQPQPTNALFTGATSPSLPSAPGPTSITVVPPPPPAVSVLMPSTSPAPEGKSSDTPPQWQPAGQWKFNGAQISEISHAVAKHISLYEEGLFGLIAHCFLPRLQELTFPQLQRLRDAFDTVRHDSDVEFLRGMRAALKQREFRRVCKAFRLGNCKFGDRCVYSHV